MNEKLWLFEDALRYAADMKKVVLLGSGFSAELDKRYLYPSLKEEADTLSPELKRLFSELETDDFEEVIRAFCHANFVCLSFNRQMHFNNEIEAVKCALLQAISKTHHSRPHEISSDRIECCINFLKPFDQIFTLNYDLLLYWVLMRSKDLKSKGMDKFDFKDGFGRKEDDRTPMLTAGVSNANFHFIHGALHLFELDKETKKLNLKMGDGHRLIDQIRGNLAENRFPLIISEGRHQDKIKKIEANTYLKSALNHLKAVGQKAPTAFFSYGVSFNQSDKHILESLEQSECKVIFIGVYGKENEDKKQFLMANLKRALVENRIKHDKEPFKVTFYDSDSAYPWSRAPEEPSLHSAQEQAHTSLMKGVTNRANYHCSP